MKNEKGISLIALLLVIVIIFGCIFLFKVMSDKEETENTKESSNPSTSINNSPTTSNNGNSPSTSTNNNASDTTGLRK